MPEITIRNIVNEQEMNYILSSLIENRSASKTIVFTNDTKPLKYDPEFYEEYSHIHYVHSTDTLLWVEEIRQKTAQRANKLMDSSTSIRLVIKNSEEYISSIPESEKDSFNSFVSYIKIYGHKANVQLIIT